MTTTPHSAHWFDGEHIHGTCACGHDCSTHPDAAYPLAGCGDCGADTCQDCRVDDTATRCSDCAAVFYAESDYDPDWEYAGEGDAGRGAINTTGETLRKRLAFWVENGKVFGAPKPDAVAMCDRCGKTFPAKFIYCACRG